MDIQAWCGLTRLREVVEPLRSQLRVYRDESGRDLFDPPDGPLPDPDTPAPPRFFPEYDNAFLGHADRSRIAPLVIGEWDWPRGPFKGSFLVDGFFSGFWRVELERGSARLMIEPFDKLAKRDREPLLVEAKRLLDFVLPDAKARDVRIGVPS